MLDVELVLAQVDALHHKIRTAKKKIADKEWQPLYKQVCAAFREATPQQRVDIQIALENRDALLSLFVSYLTKMTETALKAAGKDNRKIAIPALEEALTADAIVDGRFNIDELQRIHRQLEATAAETRYDMEAFLHKLATPVPTYLERAYTLHKAGNRSQAIRTLGRALQLDHSLQKQEHIADFAAVLTGKSPQTALLTLEDPYLRNLYIEECENPSHLRKTVEARHVSRQASSKMGIGAGVILAALTLLVIVGAAGYWLIYLR
jgi:tetratricopeptide (TPR) repeat protein